MRPTRLVMNAFGPYRGKIDLDFTAFGSSSIFLVTGPTGSGKTTIFDALTYALFNQASGDTRELDMLKSQFATDEDYCFVELTFDIGTTTYTVNRSPKQTGPGTRVKTRELPANVEFYRGEELLETGRDANEAIAALIGLTYQQFRQIVMLPQGEFRRLLQSNSREKEEIFRNIFGTEEIEQFQEVLKERRKNLKKEFQTYENRLEQSLSSIHADEHSALKEAIELSDYEEVIALLKALVDTVNKELTAVRQKVKSLNQNEQAHETLVAQLQEKEELEQAKKNLAKEAPEINKLEQALALHKQAEEVKVAFDAFEKAAKELKETQTDLAENKANKDDLKKEIEQLLERNKAAKKSLQNMDAVRKEVTQLEAEQKTFEELERKNDHIKKHEKDVQTATKNIKEFKQADEVINKKSKELKADLNNIQVWRETLSTEQEEQAATHKKQQVVAEQIETLENIIEMQADLAELLQEKKTASAKYHEAQENYEQAQEHYFGDLAGILVAELEDDQPCPVCGATHHPNPATPPAETITEETLNEYETIRNEKQAADTKLATMISQKGEQITVQEVGLDDYEVEYKEALETLKAKETTLAKDYDESEKAIKALEEKIAQEDDWRKALEKLQSEQQDHQIKLTQEKSQQSNLFEKIEELETEIKAIKAEQQSETVKEVEAEIEKRQTKIKQVQQEAEAAQEELAEAQNKEGQIETSIEMLNKQLTKQETEKAEQEKIYQELLDDYTFDNPFTEYLLNEATENNYQEQVKKHQDETLYNSRQLKQVQAKLKEVDEALTIDALKEDLNELREEKTALENKRDDLIGQMSKYEQSYQEIKDNYAESQKIHEPLAIYEELAEIANGSTRTNYVSFERYVLSIYFEEVLFAANQRFETMTNGRYELERRKERTKGQSPEGLEIDVFDRYVGSTRSVKTLSGGETFKAALALALGLSDVIQNQQGGVHVDTLFVDEGFGTLDADSLEMAIETLMDLQSTGRLIGVISHVSALKSRIPSRIVVENKQEGSSARIEIE